MTVAELELRKLKRGHSVVIADIQIALCVCENRQLQICQLRVGGDVEKSRSPRKYVCIDGSEACPEHVAVSSDCGARVDAEQIGPAIRGKTAIAIVSDTPLASVFGGFSSGTLR
jgi:hypothetical protein